MIDPVTLTRELVAIPSPTGDEHAVTAYLADRLAALGWSVTRQAVADGRENLYARRDDPIVVLSTHLDTVPPEIPVTEDAEWLHGRGVCDAKGIAAAMTAAAETLAAAGERRVALLFVVGEEDGSDGARAAASLEPKGKYLVNGEPTGNHLVTAQKGALRVTLEAVGRPAHSGYPHLGESAIEHLLGALERIRRIPLPVDPVLGPCTLNVGKIEGGVAPNVLAPDAHAVLLIRLVGPSDRLRAAIVDAAGPSVAVDFSLEIPPTSAPALAGWPRMTVAFASDLPFHHAWGTCYQLGPGSIHVAHTAHESIAKRELHEGANEYVRIIRALLALEPADV